MCVSFLPKSVPIHAKCSGDGRVSARVKDEDWTSVRQRRCNKCGWDAVRRVSRRAETYVGQAFSNGPRFRPISLNCTCLSKLFYLLSLDTYGRFSPFNSDKGCMDFAIHVVYRWITCRKYNSQENIFWWLKFGLIYDSHERINGHDCIDLCLKSLQVFIVIILNFFEKDKCRWLIYYLPWEATRTLAPVLVFSDLVWGQPYCVKVLPPVWCCFVVILWWPWKYHAGTKAINGYCSGWLKRRLDGPNTWV